MSKENSKILISAGGGKVGQHVVTQLAQKKIPARVADRPDRPRALCAQVEDRRTPEHLRPRLTSSINGGRVRRAAYVDREAWTLRDLIPKMQDVMLEPCHRSELELGRSSSICLRRRLGVVNRNGIAE
jgi:hypothetical protein